MTKMNHIIPHLINYILTIVCFGSIYYAHQFLFVGNDGTLLIAAFGASAVLVFSKVTIQHSLITVFLSAIIAAIIGVFCNQLNFDLVFKVLLALSSSILIMSLLNISYPPAGAIAIIPMLSNSSLQDLGYLYVIYPTVTGLIIIYSFSKIKEKLNTVYYGKSKNN